MQSLLTRASQAHGCSCRACAHVSNSTIRRSNTAVYHRKRPRVGNVFAAYHSKSLGTASVLDISCKGGRRKELLRKSEAARKGLAQLRESSSLASPQADQNPMRLPPHEYALETLSSICKTELDLETHENSESSRSIFLVIMNRIFDRKETLGSPYFNILGQNMADLDAALEEERLDYTFRHREPRSQLQFDKYHEKIIKLVDILIEESYYDETPWDPEAARLSFNSLDSAMSMMRMLRSEGYPRYDNPALDLEATIAAREKLSETFRTHFEQWETGNIRKTRPKIQIARICYSMLVSPVPPSIHHINALILGFTQKGKHNFAEVVVDWFLEDSKLRPSQQTIVCLLLHYRKKGDLFGFYSIIRRLTAVDRRGMLLRRRWFECVLRNRRLRRWAKRPLVTTDLSQEWVIQIPERNRDIYEAIISGLLRFNRVKDAAKVLIAALYERQGISIELLIYLLKQCVYNLDTSAADILLCGFAKNANIIVSLLIRPGTPSRLAEYIFPLFHLGDIPGGPYSRERAAMVLGARTSLDTPGDSEGMARVKDALFMKQAETQIRRLEEVLRPLKYIWLEGNPERRTELALCGIQGLEELEGYYLRLAKTLHKYQSLGHVYRTLESDTWDVSAANIATIYRKAVRRLKQILPQLYKGEGYKTWEIRNIADAWFRYRLRKMEGIRSDVNRIAIDAKLTLMIGDRLSGSALRLLVKGTPGFKQLDISKVEDGKVVEKTDVVEEGATMGEKDAIACTSLVRLVLARP